MKIQDRLYPNSRVLHNVTVPVVATQTILVLDTAKLVIGNTLQVYLQVAAVDVGSPAEASNTIIEVMIRVVAAGPTPGPITANRLDKRVTGGANTFAQDVNFSIGPVAVGSGEIALLAGNAVAPRMGNLSIFWMVNRGDFA